MLTSYQVPYRTPLIASLMLLLTVLQGTSFTLTLAVRSAFASDLASALVTVLWLAMYLLAVVGLIASHGLNWATWLVRYRLPLVILLAGTTLSVAWSVDSGLSFERVVHLLGSSLIAVYLGFSLPLNRMLRQSAIVLGLLMLASMIAALFIPDLGLENYEGQLVWTGVLASKNTLGFWSAITILLLLSLSFWTVSTSSRLLYLAFSVVAALCLYNSVSATSVLALISGGLVMMYLYTALSLRLGMLAMALLGVLVCALVAVAFYYIDTAELIGRSGDLTGRGEVWKQTWKLILERPLTGFGYGTIWYPTDASLGIQQSLTDFSWIVYHAHNGLLQIASEVGLPLTILAIIMIVQQLIELIYCQYQRQQPGMLFVLGFVVAFLLSNYSEARLLIHRELYWIFFIAMPISMLQQVTVLADTTEFPNMPMWRPGTVPGPVRTDTRQVAQRRSLKRRLKQHRKVTIINDVDNSSGDKTDSVVDEAAKPTLLAERERNLQRLANIPAVIYKDNIDPQKRKLARRQRKPG